MNLLPDQRARLESFGDVKLYDSLPSSPDEWMKRTEGYEVICSGKYGLTEKIYERKDVFYSLPFVAVGWIDKEKLSASGNTVSYSPGCNSYAVSEWIVSMTLLLMRKFNRLVNASELENKSGSPEYLSLATKKACILGRGNIGSKVGKSLEALGMNVVYYGRGDNLLKSVNSGDVVVNTLSSNQSTEGLLNREFFSSFDGSTFFVTVTSSKIYDSKAMLEVLEQNKLLGVADDCGSILPGDYDDPYYKELLSHSRILVTPHISYQSDVTVKISNDMMIDNVEAWIKGEPINLYS